MFTKTARLTIREFTIEDLDAFSDLMSNEEVMRFSVAGPLSRDQARDYLQKRIMSHYVEHGFGMWAIVHTADNRLIGSAGLMMQTIDRENLVELGYRLHPAYWGKGLALEAAAAIAEYGFTELHLEQIISIIDPKNDKSVGIASRLGMHYWKDAIFHNILVKIYVLKKVAVSPFDEMWRERFEQEKQQLQQAFKNLDITFFHIGSTSIPGCSAKPVIDILGVTPDILEVDRFNQEMIAIGFKPFGEYGMMQRRFFHRKTASPVNLHIFEDSDPEVGRHLRFCNYLKSHPDEVKEYSELKVKLALQFPHDIQRYILGKEAFIKSIDMLAAWEATPEIANQISKPRRAKWSAKEIIKALQVNMHLQMIYFAKHVPSMQMVYEPDATVVRSPIPDDTFNYVLAARFTENNALKRITHVVSLFQKQGLPFSWWVGESDTPSNLGALLLQKGFVFKETDIGMYKDLAHFKSIQASSPLTFKRVESTKHLRDFADVIEAIGGSSQAFDLIYSQLPPVIYAGESSLEMHVAYLENMPVVTGMLVTHANVAGIYYVATIPNQRKKGFGTAMLNHLLERAKKKRYLIATLQASEEGLSLYERLGFNRCCQFVEYAPQKLSPA